MDSLSRLACLVAWGVVAASPLSQAETVAQEDFSSPSEEWAFRGQPHRVGIEGGALHLKANESNGQPGTAYLNLPNIDLKQVKSIKLSFTLRRADAGDKSATRVGFAEAKDPLEGSSPRLSISAKGWSLTLPTDLSKPIKVVWIEPDGDRINFFNAATEKVGSLSFAAAPVRQGEKETWSFELKKSAGELSLQATCNGSRSNLLTLDSQRVDVLNLIGFAFAYDTESGAIIDDLTLEES